MMFSSRTVRYYSLSITQPGLVLIVVLIFLTLFSHDTLQLGSEFEDEDFTIDAAFLVMTAVLFTISSIIFYLVFTKLSGRAIRLIYSIILTSPYLILINEALLSIYAIQNLWLRFSYILAFLFLTLHGMAFLHIYQAGKSNIVLRNSGLYISAAILGRIFALSFPTLVIMTFSSLLVVYDIYSVGWGPLSKIIGKPKRTAMSQEVLPNHVLYRVIDQVCKKGTPVVISRQNTLLGIGDLLLFSILLFQAFVTWQWLGLALTFIALVIGSYLTLYLLKRISPLPALPFPVTLALIIYSILYFGNF